MTKSNQIIYFVVLMEMDCDDDDEDDSGSVYQSSLIRRRKTTIVCVASYQKSFNVFLIFIVLKF